MRTKLVLLVLLLMFIPVVLSAEEVAKIIAKVNNQVITTADLDDYCKVFALKISDKNEELSCENEEVRREAYRRLIEDRLILDKARKDDIKIPESLVENKFAQLFSVYPSLEEFEASLAEKGLNITLVKDKIREQYLMRTVIDKYVKSFVSVSPLEVSRYYTDNEEKFYSKVGYIFYIAKNQDKRLLKNIYRSISKNGIVKTAQEYADILLRMESGRDELREEIADIFKDLEQGDAEIREIDDNFYLIYLEEKVLPALLPLDRVKDKAYAMIWEGKFSQRFKEWVLDLRKKAVVEDYYE